MAKKRVTAKKYMGDDRYSWAVFLDGYPIVTGIAKTQVPYYKKRVREMNKIAETDAKR